MLKPQISPHDYQKNQGNVYRADYCLNQIGQGIDQDRGWPTFHVIKNPRANGVSIDKKS